MKRYFILAILLQTLNATNIENFIDLQQCDQIIDKQIYQICYSYKNKGAVAVWYKLDAELVNKKNIEARPKFYNEKNIPIKYRTKPEDYTNSGFDRGHLASDANFDYDKKAQLKTYSMANIVPQHPTLNRKHWANLEKYERYLTINFTTINVINLVDYSKSTNQIGKSKLSVPNAFYKIIYNDEHNFKKCFKYDNIEINKNDSVAKYQIECERIKL